MQLRFLRTGAPFYFTAPDPQTSSVSHWGAPAYCQQKQSNNSRTGTVLHDEYFYFWHSTFLRFCQYLWSFTSVNVSIQFYGVLLLLLLLHEQVFYHCYFPPNVVKWEICKYSTCPLKKQKDLRKLCSAGALHSTRHTFCPASAFFQSVNPPTSEPHSAAQSGCI